MNNRIYISGKVTGDPDYLQKFKSARWELELSRRQCSAQKSCPGCIFYDRNYIYECTIKDLFPEHFEIVNPATFPVANRPWLLAMVYCVRKLMGCSYVYMLNDWQQSRGAKIEHRIAKVFNKQIIYQK